MSRAERDAVRAAELLADLPDRWVHTEGVVRRARRVSETMSSDDGEMLVAAAYLHDIGYAWTLAQTGFHPLDGARHLRELGEERLAGLVAYHSGAEAEARLRGLGDQLAQFDRESSEVADALTYCDVTTGADGAVVGIDERLSDVEDRRDEDDPVVVALRLARPEIERAVNVIEAKLERTAEP
jgi:HD superfamily phosphodiesterase